MAATKFIVPMSHSDNAAFQAWAQAAHAALLGQGLVQTADTGQVDLTTMVRPGTNLAAGYTILRFDDPLQATAPIFIKVEYGSGGNAAYPQIWITVGTATDGAGTLQNAPGLGGTVTSRATAFYTSTNQMSGLPTASWAMSDGSGVYLLMWPSAYTSLGGGFFLVERTRNFDGTPNGDGFVLLNSYSYSGGGWASAEIKSFLFLPDAFRLQGTLTSGWPVLSGGSSGAGGCRFSQWTIGETFYPQPVFTGQTPRFGGPSQLVMACGKTDFATLGEFDMDHYGAERRWMHVGTGSGAHWGSIGNNADSFIVRVT